VNQFFWPDLAATGLLLTDVVRHLADQGHEITVICGASTYAVSESSLPPRARVIRIPNLPFGRAKIMRLFSYASFYAGAAIRALGVPKPDLIVSMTTPPLLSVLGHALKTTRRARHFIWEMDLYPDIAVDLQVLPERSLLTRIIGSTANFTRRRADGVIALGECMKRRITGHGVPEHKVHVAHNWADGERIRPPAYRDVNGKLTIVYAGHLGMAHDIATVGGAIYRLDSTGKYRFVFVGGGPRAKDLEAFAKARNLKSAEFLPFCTRDELNTLLACTDIGLVTQKNECTGSLVPSKLYAQLAAGLPLLYVGPSSATPGAIIHQHGCGWRVDCGDVDSLVELLQNLARNRHEVIEKGELARTVFLRHFDRPVSVSRIASILGLTQQPPETPVLRAEESRCTAF
jgi:glycosyltransferase involved in cell wall biosynthesis